MENLKPRPFCGCHDRRVGIRKMGKTGYKVICSRCGSSGPYVRVDDVMELINTSNRGSCDYFIVDQIEELCRSEKIYDLDKVVEELDKLADKANDKILEAGELQLYYDGYEDALRTAVEIVKGGGV